MTEYQFPSPVGYVPRTDTLIGCVSSTPQREDLPMQGPRKAVAAGTHKQQSDAAWVAAEDQVLAALNSIAGPNGYAQSWTSIKTLMGALPRRMSEDQVRVALDRLAESGRVKKRGRGQWRSAVVRCEQ